MQRTERGTFPSTRPLRFHAAIQGFLFFLFGASIAGKAIDPWGTATVLATSWGLDPNVAAIGVVSLVTTEGAILIWLLAPGRCRAPLLAAAVFLLGVSAGPIKQLLIGEAGDCGCGLASLHSGFKQEPYVVVARNVALAVACGAAASTTRTQKVIRGSIDQ